MSTPAIQQEWARRTIAEYRSAAVTQHLVLWLIQIGASPDLIRQGNRIVDDELGHAEGSLEVLARAGGHLQGAVDRRRLSLPEPEVLELGVVRAAVELFCLGETVAVPLFRRMLQGARQRDVRVLLKRILRDEARHRQYGWTLLQWMLEGPIGPDARLMLESELPSMLGAVRAAYGQGRARDLPDEERAWGLLPTGEYSDALAWAERRWYQPRFAALGLPIG